MPKGRGFGTLQKGERITDLSALQLGHILLEYSTQFDAENTVKVVAILDGRVYVRFVNPENTDEFVGPEFCIWHWELESTQLWFAETAKQERDVTEWLAIPAYGHFYRLNDGELEYRPMMDDGTMDPDEDAGGFADPFEGAPDAVHRLSKILENFLENPQTGENVMIGVYLRMPQLFQTPEAKSVLPIVCEEHGTRFGDHCNCL